jgi:purine-binding chemotaxis protein CheW
MAGLQIITFDVNGTACALRRDQVRELLPLPRLWRPPALPRPVAGFFNLGGKAVPVIRLDALFGLEENQEGGEAALYRHLILVQVLGQPAPAALLADRVLDVANIAADQLSPVREGSSLNGCVEAEITLGSRLVHLLSLERLLFAEEQQALAELGRHAQNRLGEWTVPA